mmetsp:Transcript_165526/g.531186  ORF Transcript_165526/g.531186 Transcript_165526/m.531186 type:complete len:140 (-) Transcript_165526:61-480(-)
MGTLGPFAPNPGGGATPGGGAGAGVAQMALSQGCEVTTDDLTMRRDKLGETNWSPSTCRPGLSVEATGKPPSSMNPVKGALAALTASGSFACAVEKGIPTAMKNKWSQPIAFWRCRDQGKDYNNQELPGTATLGPIWHQ